MRPTFTLPYYIASFCARYTLRLLDTALPVTPRGYSDSAADDYTATAADDEVPYE